MGEHCERHCPLYAAVRGGHAEAVSRLIAGALRKGKEDERKKMEKAQ